MLNIERNVAGEFDPVKKNISSNCIHLNVYLTKISRKADDKCHSILPHTNNIKQVCIGKDNKISYCRKTEPLVISVESNKATPLTLSPYK